MRKQACFVFSVIVALGSISCSSSGGARCDFSKPAALAQTSWPKFQRDGQNSGAIVTAPLRLNAAPVARFQVPEGSPFVVQPVLGNGGPSKEPSDQRVYVGNTNGRLYALDAQTLNPLPGSSFDFANAFPIRTTALVGVRTEQEVLFFGSDQGFVFAVDQTGAKQNGFFPFNVGGPTGIAAALHPSDGTIYAGTSTRSEVGICPNGVLRFLSTAIAPVTAAPALTQQGNVVWAAADRTLRLTRNDGFLLWSVSLSAPLAGAPVVATEQSDPTREFVYAVDSAARVTKIDAATGQPLYVLDIPADRTQELPLVVAAPAVSANRLYVATVSGELYAIETASGDIVWSQALPGEIQAPLAVLEHDSGRSIVAPSVDGNIYVVEDTGPLPGGLQQIAVGARITGGVAVSAIDPDHAVLFVADEAGAVSRIE
jgi:outer membrane protein assembly factor BamB